MTHTILVVDDDAAIRDAFDHQLSALGYAVRTSATAAEGLAALREVSPSVIISDIRMPGLDGLELLAHLRALRPDIPVIMVTAHQDMQTAIAAMKAGAYDYLVKPLDLDRIETLLGRCIHDRARSTPHASDEEGEVVSSATSIDRLVGRDARMIEIYKTIGVLAQSRTPVLIRGETGTGKELIARSIHANAESGASPFVAINCSALPEPLLESELFGHMRGAFTGATSDRKGRFELAGRGTIFLDEIGDTSLAFQAKLLRVLQEREFTPVGAERARRTEARVIAATHRPLEAMIAAGTFRQDLYYRLRVVEIAVPPLRSRKMDIPVLAEAFVEAAAAESPGRRLELSRDAVRVLEAHSWPGNVRELENAIRRAVATARGNTITPDLLALDTQTPPPSPASSDGVSSSSPAIADDSMAGAERAHVLRILAKTGGNKRMAARLLRVSRAKLDRLLVRLGISLAPE